MDTRFLESFITVVELGSIAAAARNLNVTPAAIAQRLHTLEDEIGTRLFTRAGRRVRPTAAGLEIVERVKRLLRDVRDIKAVANSDIPAGELRLGAISTALTGLAPDVIQSLAARHPQVEIYILPGVSAELYRNVVNGELDAAIIVKPQFAVPKSCDWRTLCVQPLVALTPTALKFRDLHKALADHPFILYDTAQWGGQVVSRYLRSAGIAPHVRFRLDALEGIVALVERGLGIALVPDWKPLWPKGLAIHRVPTRHESTNRLIGLLWRRASPRISLVRAFIEQTQRVPE